MDRLNTSTAPALRLSAVICTRDRPDLIGRAAASVLANDHRSFELLVVDQSSSDSTRRVLADLARAHRNLRYMRPTGVGLSLARNVAIAHANGELVAFTDDDCVVPQDWLRRIDRVFTQETDVDLVYGQVRVPTELQRSGGVVPALTIPTRRRISRHDGFRIYGMGANFAARRRLFEVVQGFDETLGAGGPLPGAEDFDFEYRVFRAGLVTLLTPEIVLDHYGLRSEVDWPKTLAAYGTGDAGFLMKHARCGDLFATRLLIRRFGREVLALGAKRLIRRQCSSAYVRGAMRGLRQSFRYPIDHKQRLYVSRVRNRQY